MKIIFYLFLALLLSVLTVDTVKWQINEKIDRHNMQVLDTCLSLYSEYEKQENCYQSFRFEVQEANGER